MNCLNHPQATEGLVVCWRCRRRFCQSCVVELQSYYFCRECKAEQVRDMLAGTDTLALEYARPGRRILAWLVDGLVKAGIGAAVKAFSTVVISATGSDPARVAVLSVLAGLGAAVLGTIYEGAMLAGANGQTLGKMALNLRVVTPEGNRITAAQAWVRSSFKLVLFVTTCTCGLVDVLLDGAFALGNEGASLHDLVAKTRVVNAS